MTVNDHPSSVDLPRGNGVSVLVTGGTGFVSGWAIVALLTSGYQVRTTVRDERKAQIVTDAVSTQVDPADRLTFAVADLNGDAGWDEAMAGIDYVLHIAAPIGASMPDDPDQAIETARGGTLRVLESADRAGVRRVVMTSAAATASPSSYTEDSVSDETVWTDPDDPTLIPYRRAKTVAELAAWRYVEGRPGSPELVTVLPGAVFGPVLGKDSAGSVSVIINILATTSPGQPRIGLEVVDVRDLVDAHLRAMTNPDAPGERFLATGEFVWMRDIAEVLRAKLGATAAHVATAELPDDTVREAARERNPGLRAILPALGRRSTHSTAKAEKLLGWRSRAASETIADCAASLVEHGLVPAPGK